MVVALLAANYDIPAVTAAPARAVDLPSGEAALLRDAGEVGRHTVERRAAALLVVALLLGARSVSLLDFIDAVERVIQDPHGLMLLARPDHAAIGQWQTTCFVIRLPRFDSSWRHSTCFARLVSSHDGLGRRVRLHEGL